MVSQNRMSCEIKGKKKLPFSETLIMNAIIWLSVCLSIKLFFWARNDFRTDSPRKHVRYSVFCHCLLHRPNNLCVLYFVIVWHQQNPAKTLDLLCLFTWQTTYTCTSNTPVYHRFNEWMRKRNTWFCCKVYLHFRSLLDYICKFNGTKSNFME